MVYKTIIHEVSEKVATITLNRPEKGNPLNKLISEELLDCLNHCDDDPETRAIILTASGKVFCSGGDLEAVHSFGDSMHLGVPKLLSHLHPMVSKIRSIGLPVIAAVNGPAIGGGTSLAIACDLVVAAKSARFNSHYVLIGASPDCGMTHMLPRLVGLKKATCLMFTGEVFNAQQAYEMGIVNQVVEDSELLNDTKILAKKLAAGATLAIAQTKELINKGLNESFDAQMDYERQALAHIGRSHDFNEAIRAFNEKRKPKFKGS